MRLFLTALIINAISATYITATKSIMEGTECPIMAEENKIETSIIIRTDDKLLHSFNAETLLQWRRSHPSTRRPFFPFEIERMQIHVDYQTSVNYFGDDVDQIALEYFMNFINNDTFDVNLILYLQRWLNFDVMDDFFKQLGMNPKENDEEERRTFAHFAICLLKHKESGTWLMRPSKYRDNSELSRAIRTLSYRKRDKLEHCRIGYFAGFGYCILQSDWRGLDDLKVFDLPQVVKFYPCLFSLLQFLSASNIIVFSKAFIQ